MFGKRGPKPALREFKARKLTLIGSAADGGLPEPDATLDAEELGGFNRLLRQTGGHLKRADSAPLSLLARQLVEETQLKTALRAIDPATHPNEYLGARRALTSLQGAAGNSMKLLGIGPKARASGIELKPLPQQTKDEPGGKGGKDSAPLPFDNDSGIADSKVRILADVTWDGLALDAAEADQKRTGKSLPSLRLLCRMMSDHMMLFRLTKQGDDDNGAQANPAQLALINKIAERFRMELAND